jgi:hypothetical protein
MRRIALAAAVVSALVAALVLLRHREDRALRAMRTMALLPDFDERQVTGLVLHAHSTTWRLARESSGWRIVTPVVDVADARSVEALIGAVRRAPIVQTLSAPDDLSSYGLEPPGLQLTLDGVTMPAIEVGTVTPTGESVFARLAGHSEVLLLGLPDATPLVELDPASLRDRSLVERPRSGLVGMVLEKGALHLERGADGWWITSPHRFPASAARVDALLGALYGARIIGWDDLGDAADAKYGLGTGAPRVTLRSEGETQTITFGADAGKGNRFVSSEGRKSILIADVPRPALAPLDLNALRDSRLTNVNRYDVTRLVYASAGARFAASRKDEATWITDAGGTVSAERVYTLLVALLSAETVAVSDGALDGTSSATLSYVTGDGGAAGSLTFADDRATWDALPGVVFRLAAPPPRVPN